MTGRVWTERDVRALGVRTDVATAGSVLGLGRSAAYEAVRTGGFPVPVIRAGGHYVVPVAPLLRLLGLDDETGGTD